MVNVPTVSDAIKYMFIVEFNYNGEFHVVEPHAVGTNGFDVIVLNGNKINNSVDDGNYSELIYYDLRDINGWKQTTETFDTISPDYRHDDMMLVTIFQQV